MEYSENERISHVARRLGFGIEPEILNNSNTVDDAITATLDLTEETPEPTDLVTPIDLDSSKTPQQRQAPFRYWFTQMIEGPRRIEERLTWFWHDHFATSDRDVKMPYMMYVQHLMLRKHATGNFADLLYEVATDPAMLFYLDGVQNKVGSINENFGREVMELFTLGIGNYTEEDVLAASAAFSGWIVTPGAERAERFEAEPWTAHFVPKRHDATTHTLLGNTGSHDAQDAVDILLDQPATAEYVGSKLYRELVGLEPDSSTTKRIADAFRRDYSIMSLVEAVIDSQAFTSNDAIRAKVRTPLERAIGLAQVYGYENLAGRTSLALRTLENLGYAPFNPPNVAGYPKGTRLLGPYDLVHGFDLTGMLPEHNTDATTTELTERLGIFDLTEGTRKVLRPSYPFLRNFGRSGKGSFTEKTKIVN